MNVWASRFRGPSRTNLECAFLQWSSHRRFCYTAVIFSIQITCLQMQSRARGDLCALKKIIFYVNTNHVWNTQRAQYQKNGSIIIISPFTDCHSPVMVADIHLFIIFLWVINHSRRPNLMGMIGNKEGELFKLTLDWEDFFYKSLKAA